jgi:hypothetical protein
MQQFPPSPGADGTCSMCGACGAAPAWAPEALAGASPGERDAVFASLASKQARFLAHRDNAQGEVSAQDEVFITPPTSPAENKGSEVNGAESDGGASMHTADGDTYPAGVTAGAAAARRAEDGAAVMAGGLATVKIVDDGGWPEDQDDGDVGDDRLEVEVIGGGRPAEFSPPEPVPLPSLRLDSPSEQRVMPQLLEPRIPESQKKLRALSAVSVALARHDNASGSDDGGDCCQRERNTADTRLSDDNCLEHSVSSRRLRTSRWSDVPSTATPNIEADAAGGFDDDVGEPPMQPVSPSHVEVSLKSPQMHSRSYSPSTFSYHEQHCNQCEAFKVRIDELEEHNEALQSALEARAMANISLRAKTSSPRSSSSSQLREEVDSLRLTVDFRTCSHHDGHQPNAREMPRPLQPYLTLASSPFSCFCLSVPQDPEAGGKTATS